MPGKAKPESPPDQSMRLMLDLRILQSADANRGIGHYSRGLAEALIRISAENNMASVAVVQDAERPPVHWDRARPHEVFSIQSPCTAGFRNKIRSLSGRDENDARALDRAAARWDADLVHIASPLHGPFHWNNISGIATVATLYDLIPLEQRDDFYDVWAADAQKTYKKRLKRLKELTGLLAISSSAAQSAENLLGLPAYEVCIAWPGLREPFSSKPNVGKPISERKGVLAFASSNPSKNSDVLIPAYAGIEAPLRSEHPLLLMLPHDMAFRQHLALVAQDCGVADEVRFLLSPEDQEIINRMQSARCFVLPSRYEGFGLPALEAASCGLPVLASDIQVLHEVTGDNARFFNPLCKEDVTAAITNLLKQPDKAESLAKRAFQHCARFDWDDTARTVWTFFQRLALNNKQMQ